MSTRAENAAREMMAAPTVTSPLTEAYLAEQEQRLLLRGKAHGLSVAEVLAADRTGMDLRRYAAYRGVLNAAQAEIAEERLRDDALAMAQAQRELAVTAAKASLR